LKTFKTLIILIIAAISTFGLSCKKWGSSESVGQTKQVILISIDTCRADYLGCYGYPRPTSSNIDAFAAEGVLFEHVVTPVPLTLPAHSSMLTGTIPPYHRVHDNINYRFSEDNVSVAEIFQKAGFETAGFVSAFVMEDRFGLSQGFDHYDDESESSSTSGDNTERPAAQTTERACDWLDQHQEDDFFLFVHYYDPHEPYQAPKPFAGQYGPGMHGAYAAEIAYTDYHIGKLLSKLKSLDIYDSALIIITSDHGEALGEHGEPQHGYFIYEGNIRVPLIIKGPGENQPRRIEQIVGLVDIVPTICKMTGMNEPNKARGIDLSAYLMGREPQEMQRYLYSESVLPCNIECNPLLGVSTQEWKYIQTTRDELYDLRQDPTEQNNLAVQQAKRAGMMQKQLAAILEDNQRLSDGSSQSKLDEESLRILAGMGYVGSGVRNDSLEVDRQKNDPKDYIDLHIKKSIVELDILNWELERAKKASQRLLKEYPKNATTHYLRGQIAARENDWPKAYEAFSQALKIDPDDFHSCLGAGRAALNLSKLDESMAFLKKAQLLNPEHMDLKFFMGRVYIELGKYEEAVGYLEDISSFMPDDMDVHLNLAIALSYLGQTERAKEYFQAAELLATDKVKMQLIIADHYIGLNRIDQAITHYNKALKINPDYPFAYEKLGLAYATIGNMKQAVILWKKSLSLKPDWPEVMNNLAWLFSTQSDPEIFNPDKAIELAKRACDLTDYKQPGTLDTLGAAYAAKGDFAQAVQSAEKAINLAQQNGNSDLAQRIQKRLELYKLQKPYRE